MHRDLPHTCLPSCPDCRDRLTPSERLSRAIDLLAAERIASPDWEAALARRATCHGREIPCLIHRGVTKHTGGRDLAGLAQTSAVAAHLLAIVSGHDEDLISLALVLRENHQLRVKLKKAGLDPERN